MAEAYRARGRAGQAARGHAQFRSISMFSLVPLLATESMMPRPIRDHDADEGPGRADVLEDAELPQGRRHSLRSWTM
jgi:hypothetical protein